jgi:outer membrane protein
MNKNLPRACIAAAVFGLLGTGLAQAQQGQGPWMLRARLVQINTANKSSAEVLPANAISVSNKTIPEVDVTYFFTPNIAAELVLTIPQKHTVNVKEIGDIGTFKELPPTLMAQYHFMPDDQIRPYAGVGLNYTSISSVNLNVPGVGPLTLTRNSYGLAIGAGVDIELAKDVFLNFDVKKVQIRSDVLLQDGTKIAKVKVDPWLFGVGIGYRF